MGKTRPCIVYVLRSLKDGKLYTGLTENLPRRIREHNRGKTESTRHRRPFVLVYTEEYATREEASTREAFLKSGRGREELGKILDRAVLNPPNNVP
jgi:putative endonuclease